MKIQITAIILLPLFTLFAQAQDHPPVEAYHWQNVQIVGGGFVDGIIFHPTEAGVCYYRTDMGGAYRRNLETLRWEVLCIGIPRNRLRRGIIYGNPAGM